MAATTLLIAVPAAHAATDVSIDPGTLAGATDHAPGDEGDDFINVADGQDEQAISCDDAPNLDSSCETVSRSASQEGSGSGSETFTPAQQPAPAVAPTVAASTPASVRALGLTVRVGAKVATDSTGAVKLLFSCGTTKCAARKLTLKAKVGGKTLKMTVTVPALAPGQKTSVRLTLSRVLAKAVANTGKRGVKVTIAGPTGGPVTLTLVKKH